MQDHFYLDLQLPVKEIFQALKFVPGKAIKVRLDLLVLPGYTHKIVSEYIAQKKRAGLPQPALKFICSPLGRQIPRQLQSNHLPLLCQWQKKHFRGILSKPLPG